mgnify:CR=1 FL=1
MGYERKFEPSFGRRRRQNGCVVGLSSRRGGVTAVLRGTPCTADACPGVIKDILIRAVERTELALTLVANQYLRVPGLPNIRMIQVLSGFDGVMYSVMAVFSMSGSLWQNAKSRRPVEGHRWIGLGQQEKYLL